LAADNDFSVCPVAEPNEFNERVSPAVIAI
jgi:hypothetical protein